MNNSMIDFMTLLVLLQLVLFIFNTNDGVNLLILSETCWIILYVNYLLFYAYYNSLEALATALPILLLAAVDCSCWLLFLVYMYLSDATTNSVNFNVKFAFRANRLLKCNRFIK